MFTTNPSLDLIFRGLILAALAMVWVILLVRVNGLRSFSKMTNFDFVTTVAIGSLLAGASQSTNWQAFIQTLIAMLSLFIFQYTAARLRQRSSSFKSVLQNDPIILMRDGKVEEKALAATRISRGDLIAKLREANVLELSEVRAVILETTGDISVLHGPKCSVELLEGTESG